MNVGIILAAKGREVVTMGQHETLAAAAETLNQHRIGAVVIVDPSGAVLGIISERDLVRAMAEKGAGALREPLQARMTSRVTTCTVESSIDDLMVVMTEGKFRHVPVVEEGHLRGIVSIGDIVKHRLAEVEAEHQALRDYIATA